MTRSPRCRCASYCSTCRSTRSVLGMGEDGHTASFFPGGNHLMPGDGRIYAGSGRNNARTGCRRTARDVDPAGHRRQPQALPAHRRVSRNVASSGTRCTTRTTTSCRSAKSYAARARRCRSTGAPERRGFKKSCPLHPHTRTGHRTYRRAQQADTRRVSRRHRSRRAATVRIASAFPAAISRMASPRAAATTRRRSAPTCVRTSRSSRPTTTCFRAHQPYERYPELIRRAAREGGRDRAGRRWRARDVRRP